MSASIKANLVDAATKAAKLSLAGVGFAVGRYAHLQISNVGANQAIFRMKSGNYLYEISTGDVINLVIAIVLYWFIGRKNAFVGMFLLGWLVYSVGFEFYELLMGHALAG